MTPEHQQATIALLERLLTEMKAGTADPFVLRVKDAAGNMKTLRYRSDELLDVHGAPLVHIALGDDAPTVSDLLKGDD